MKHVWAFRLQRYYIFLTLPQRIHNNFLFLVKKVINSDLEVKIL